MGKFRDVDRYPIERGEAYQVKDECELVVHGREHRSRAYFQNSTLHNP